MKRLVALTGAGISAESGLQTFRDADGLWEQYRIEDVATPDGWRKNPGLVLAFYNQRRKDVLAASPNKAHAALAALQEHFDVHIVTQNIDNLHERAGSRKVLHLHGEIMKSRSSMDPARLYEMKNAELHLGETCDLGSQLRPHVVWFGEMVPELENAAGIIEAAEIFLVIGTSLQVYPAAGLTGYALSAEVKYLVDPHARSFPGYTIVKEKAGTGVAKIVEDLISRYII